MKKTLLSAFLRCSSGRIPRVAILACCVLFAAPLAAAEPETQPEKHMKQQPSKSISLFDGKSVKQWWVIDAYAFRDHGEVAVANGQINIGAGSPASGIAWTGTPPRSNYEFSLDAKRTEGGDFFCGLTFPVGDSYCTFIVGGWGGGVIGLSNLDEQAAIENETTSYVEFKDDRWYRVRVRVTDAKIEAWIDNEQHIDLDRKHRKFSIWWEQEPVCPLGVATWNTGAALRNIQLRKLPGGESAKQ